MHAVDGQRPAEQVPLGAVAAEVAQPGQLVVGLDALGDDTEAKRVAELDQRSDHGRVGRVVAQGGDERAVDVHRIEGQITQAGHRRVTGTEVVQGQLYPDRAQRGQGAGGQIRVV